jgi:molecular chaperone GrpE
MTNEKEKQNSVNGLDESMAPELTADMEEVRQALAKKTEEVQALQDKYLRQAAEFENYKRLAQKDQRDYARFANENLLKELLPILDNLQRAIKAAKEVPKGGDTSASLMQGIELTHKQFQEVLAKFGIQPIAAVGQIFDPARHQAVARVESETVPQNTVLEEFQKGYLLHERIVRPAMVTVATAKAGDQERSSGEGDGW